MLSYGRWHNESPLCYINNILSIQATRNSHFKKLPKKIFFFFSHSIREKRHKIYLKVFHLRVQGRREKLFQFFVEINFRAGTQNFEKSNVTYGLQTYMNVSL